MTTSSEPMVSTLSSCRAMAIWSIYHGSDPAHQGAFVWNGGVAPGTGEYFVIMQSDGNLVVYKGSDPAHQGAFVWNSGKAPGAGVYGAAIQNDGNLVVTTGTTVLWSAQPLSPSSIRPSIRAAIRT